MAEDSGRKSVGDIAFASVRDPGRRIAANTISGYLRTLIQALLFLFLTPFIIDTLGVDEYGLWSLVWALISMFSLVNMGFGAAVGKFVADARGRGDRGAYRSSVSTLIWVHVAEGLVVMLIVGGCALISRRLFDVPDAQQDHARWLLIILGVSAAINLPLSVFRGVFFGHREWRIPNFYEIVGTVLYFAGALVLLPHFPSVTTLAIINAVAMTFGCTLIVVHAFAALPELRHSVAPRLASVQRLREIWSVSAYFAVIMVGTFIATRVDTIIIDWWLDLRDVALFAVAARVAQNVQLFGTQLASTLSPVVAELHGAEREAELRQVWLRGSKFAVALSAPLVVALALLAEPLIVTWLSEELRPAARILQLLLAGTLVVIIHGPSHNLLSMRGEQRSLAGGVLGGEGLNLALSLLLIGPFGLIGVALATLCSSVVSNAGYILGRVAKQQATTRLFFYRATLLPSAVPLVVMSAVTVGVLEAHPPTHLFEVALIGGLAVTVYWALFWVMGMDPTERGLAREKIRARLPRRCR